MKKNKKALTLAEVLVCMMILGIIAAIVIPRLKSGDVDEKANKLIASKVISEFQKVSDDIRVSETNLISTAKYMEKVGASYIFTVLKPGGSSGALADAADLAEMFADEMKSDPRANLAGKNYLNFCDHTPGCNDSNIKGFKVPKDVYIGILKYSAIKDCPSFYLPDDPDTELSPGKNFDGTARQCWGELHIETNGEKGKGEKGKDYFVFGLDGQGIVKSIGFTEAVASSGGNH